jgi:hypothetical protein
MVHCQKSLARRLHLASLILDLVCMSGEMAMSVDVPIDRANEASRFLDETKIQHSTIPFHSLRKVPERRPPGPVVSLYYYLPLHYNLTCNKIMFFPFRGREN